MEHLYQLVLKYLEENKAVEKKFFFGKLKNYILIITKDSIQSWILWCIIKLEKKMYMEEFYYKCPCE